MFKGYIGVTQVGRRLSIVNCGGDPNPLPHDLNFQLFGSGATDTTPPVTTCDIAGTNPVTITLTATDDMSGVNYTKYKIDDGTYATYTAPVEVTEAGDHTCTSTPWTLLGTLRLRRAKISPSKRPALAITIKGGLGVSATIKNTGATDLTNIDWTIDLDGKLIFVEKQNPGRSHPLPLEIQSP